jgi:tyrosine-protein kinase Etk/Wzc
MNASSNGASGAPMENREAASSLNLHDTVDTVLQYWWVLLSVWFVILVAGVLYAMTLPAIYQADALIQVEDKKSQMPGLQQIAAALDIGQSPTVGEIEILRSREVVFKAITASRADIYAGAYSRFPIIGNWYSFRHELRSSEIAEPPFGLDEWAWGGERIKVQEFVVPEAQLGKTFVVHYLGGNDWVLRDGEAELARGAVGQDVKFQIGGGDARINISELRGRPGQKFRVVRFSLGRRYSDLIRSIRVFESAKQSNVIRVQFEDQSPQFATAFVNELAKAYLNQNVNRRSEEAQKSLAFLEEQLPILKNSLTASEELLNDFRTKTTTVNVDRENDALLQKSVQIERERIQLELKRKELGQRFRDDHPMVASLKQQIAAMEGESNRLSREVSKLPEQQRDFLRLQRDVQVNAQLYTQLLNSAQELRVAKAGTIGNVRVVDYPVVPERPIRPQRRTLLLGVAVFGFFVGLLAVFLVRTLRPTLRSVEDVEAATGLVTYAAIPESSLQMQLLRRTKSGSKVKSQAVAPHRILSWQASEDPATEAIRTLRTGLTFALMDSDSKIITVTGPTAGLGKSFVAANLAGVLAQAGKRVLAIDCDMRRPRLDTYFGRPRLPGLSEVLSGSTDIATAVQPTAHENCFVMTAGGSAPNPAELLMSARVDQLLESLKGMFEYIIIDSAPVLPVSDTLAIAARSAVTFVVARCEHSSARELIDCVRRLEGANAKVRGVVFNGVKRSRIGYGYYYRYHYGYRRA